MEKLFEIKNIVKHFPIKKKGFNSKTGKVHALNDVSFDVYKGETLGIVGESGCGKSTIGRVIIRLLDPTSGQIIYKGQDITKLDGKKLNDLRKEMQVVFQNPYSSLNPRMKVEDILKEPLILNTKLSKKEIKKEIEKLTEIVGISEQDLQKFPHEFSGGQRQRIGIARAIALKPGFIVADEPVSALDVSIQAQIINLLSDLKQEFNLTYLFISHDLSVIRYFSDRVAVMYLGEIVEIATTKDLFEKPLHPYTKALLSSIPEPDLKIKQKELLEGDIPSNETLPLGCKFHTRCPYAMSVCKEVEPKKTVTENDHQVNCHLYKC